MTADVEGLYPSISHKAGLKSLRNTLLIKLLKSMVYIINTHLDILYMHDKVKCVFFQGPWFHFETPERLAVT